MQAGKSSIQFEHPPIITSAASIVGQTEGEGPLASFFARDNNLTILRLCKKYEVPVILGSDAHISFDIARYDHIYELLQETRFPEELILNDKVEAFKKFIGR